ncbi:SDR family NAD(P)-dependent oxidoreductase [Nocardioides sediminis]|uniref:SDR family NAD(P)-dependent oxidoreductase n=1 Tax=Nocardioides sediminis TaxID=433648 RepID=UPI00131F364F|nr:SDR family oxidoreductase [Nocardioides sediminis]
MKLEGRVALITGAGSGMGRATALLFAAEGAHVVVDDIRPEAADETVALVREAGGAASPAYADVTDVEQVEAMIAQVAQDRGRLDVLYCHVGMPGAAGMDLTEEDWSASVDTNMKAAFFVASRALPLLRQAEGRGSVIFTASATGLVGSPYSPLYSMAKGGVVMLAKALAVHTAADGVRANAICPGPIDTPMLPRFFGREGTAGESGLDDELRGFLASSVPMGRAGQPEEIASVALFLASDDSSFVTGVALPVDGGITAR